MNWHELVKKTRLEKGLKKVDIDCNPDLIYQYEIGKRLPLPDTALEYTNLLDIPENLAIRTHINTLLEKYHINYEVSLKPKK